MAPETGKRLVSDQDPMADLCLLFLTGFLRNLPRAALAAIVLMAVTGLIKVQELRQLWRVSKLEFAVAAVALVGVLLFGILKGVLIAAVVSILLLIHHVARPHVASWRPPSVKHSQPEY